MKETELYHGTLRFPALMHGEGTPVLLLHGFPDCYRNWWQQVEALAAQGYCVVAPALRGYAPSCQPADGDYSLRAAVEDVCAFTEQLGERTHVVGHDWGAVVAYLACAASPERFRSLSSLAIPPLRRLPRAVLRVPEQLLLSSYMQFFQVPVLPEWWLRRDDFSGVETLWRRWSPEWEPGDFLGNAKAALAEPGVLSAALGWYRQLFRVWSGANREALGWLSRPVEVPSLVLLGKRDGCMSPRLLDHTLNQKDFPEGLEVEQVGAAGHFLHLERPERVDSLLLAHLGRS